MDEVPFEQISEYRRLFPGAQAQMVIASVAEDNTAAQCWAGGRAEDVALLWDKGNEVFYLAGTSTYDAVVEELAALLTGTIWPSAARDGIGYFTIRALTPQTEAIVPRVFEGIALRPVRKRFYAYRRKDVGPMPQPAIDGVRFLPVDAGLLGDARLANVQQIAGEVRWMWPSLDRFYDRGFGVAAAREDQLIAWCTAEYVSPNRCGIGIETVAGFQGKGIATAAATRFVAESLARGVQPHWECAVENLASVRVAEKAGFAPVEESIFWAGSPPRQSQG